MAGALGIIGALDGTMVDSPKGRPMVVDPLEALPVKVQAIEDKLDALGASVEARFELVDGRFDEVTFALVEQRQYTDSAFERLRNEMTAGFRAMTGEFGRLERKLDQVFECQ